MEYRNFGSLGIKISAFGFGCMRLPTTDKVPLSANIDEKESKQMIEYAIDNGVNYFDTAYGYHNENSEVFLGKALKGGLRNKVFIATKSPVWLIKSKQDFDKLLHTQLKRLQTDPIDFYLLHALDNYRWNNIVLKYDVINYAEKAKQAGLIKHFGFSFHDDYETFKKIIDGYDKWEFCQIQYNYMDTDRQATQKGFEYAASKNIGLIIMSPLLGGRLANPPKDIVSTFNSYSKLCSPAEWAFRWIYNHKNISTMLSGVSSFEQIKDTIRIVNSCENLTMDKEELDLIAKVKAVYQDRIKINCTKCNYCLPCPQGVNIPQNFELYNDAFIFSNFAMPRTSYQLFTASSAKASSCTQCKECEDKCPQKLDISKLLKTTDAELNKPIDENTTSVDTDDTAINTIFNAAIFP